MQADDLRVVADVTTMLESDHEEVRASAGAAIEWLSLLSPGVEQEDAYALMCTVPEFAAAQILSMANPRDLKDRFALLKDSGEGYMLMHWNLIMDILFSGEFAATLSDDWAVGRPIFFTDTHGEKFSFADTQIVNALRALVPNALAMPFKVSSFSCGQWKQLSEEEAIAILVALSHSYSFLKGRQNGSVNIVSRSVRIASLKVEVDLKWSYGKEKFIASATRESGEFLNLQMNDTRIKDKVLFLDTAVKMTTAVPGMMCPICFGEDLHCNDGFDCMVLFGCGKHAHSCCAMRACQSEKNKNHPEKPVCCLCFCPSNEAALRNLRVAVHGR